MKEEITKEKLEDLEEDLGQQYLEARPDLQNIEEKEDLGQDLV